VDGQWNLKRNFYHPSRKNLIGADGNLCGGTYGFLDSIKSIVNRTMPDRVIVMWDGFNAGKLRYREFPFYKKSREKDFENEVRVIATEGVGNPEDKEKFEMFRQKIEIQRYLEELFVRQVEEDYIEADDLIAYYILKKRPDEEVIIFSRDKDFHQLISEGVSVITPDSVEMITVHNFKDKKGYTHENALLFKCFEGDPSDDITGVSGIGLKTLLEYYPDMANERYTYERMVDEGYALNESRVSSKPKKKPLAKINKLVDDDTKRVLYRNAKLMNLRKPYINQPAIDAVNEVRDRVLDTGRSIETAMEMFTKDGLAQVAGLSNLNYFFAPFYSLQAKEKEFESSNQ